MATLQERIQNYRPTKEQLLWTAVLAVIATLVVGFGMAGWVTAGTAHKLSDQAAAKARTELAVAICVDDFMHAKDAGQRLVKLKEASFYDRSELVTKGGFATMPGEKEAAYDVAIGCAGKLSEMKPQNASL